METGVEEKIHNFPTPERLWDMVHGNITDWETKFNEVPYETYSGTRKIRYYQKNAVNNVLKAIANQYFTMGLLNGLAIVVLAIIFDRVSQSFGKRLQQHRLGSHE